MSELTKIEELKQKHNAAFHHGFATAYAVGAEAVAYAESLARELLSLRTLRDAGDEEVELIADELTAIISEMEDGTAINVLVHANGLARKLRDIAITRGQQLREVRESCPCNCHNQPSSKEAMGLDEHSNCGECIKGLLQEADVMQDSLCEKYESELREARAEIERINREFATYAEVKTDRNIELSDKITTLTAERDEARGKLTAVEVSVRNLSETLVKAEAERDEARKEKESQFLEFTKQIMGNSARDEMQNLRDAETIQSLTAELAALKACPAMAEVDAAKRACIELLAKIVLARGIEEESKPPQPNPVPSYQELRDRIDKLADIARRSIASREEVVGLLKWWVDEKKTRHGFGQHLDALATNPGESGEKARRILEIVEGK